MPEHKNKMIIVHKGFFFRNMTLGAAQTIITHNIAKDLDLKALEAAVHRLVDRNPILTGTLCFGPKDNPGVFVVPGKFDKFVFKIEPQKKDLTDAVVRLVKEGNTAELQEYVQTHLDPLVPPSQSGKEELEQQKQLFSIYVLELGEGYSYFAFRCSHAIGDGISYYNVMNEFQAIYKLQLNNQSDNASLPHPIVWEAPSAIVFDFTHQATSIWFWISMISMIIVSAICGMPPTEHILLSQDKINTKKKELMDDKDPTVPYLSTNDIVTAAICQATFKEDQKKSPYDYFNQSVNYRPRWPDCGPHDGGNVTRLVPIDASKTKGQDPKGIRRSVQSVVDNPNQDIPFWPTLTARGYNETNWACIQKTLPGTLFHVPSKSVVDANPVPCAIIYQPNPKEIGVIYKLANVKENISNGKGGLISELLFD